MGFTVKSPAHKRLGAIEEVVLDVESGSIAYAVLSFGGVFGLGDKFFAIPWQEFTLKHDEGEPYFQLDTSAERMAELPGFAKKDWSSVAGTDWDAEVDAHYRLGPGGA